MLLISLAGSPALHFLKAHASSTATSLQLMLHAARASVILHSIALHAAVSSLQADSGQCRAT